MSTSDAAHVAPDARRLILTTGDLPEEPTKPGEVVGGDLPEETD